MENMSSSPPATENDSDEDSEKLEIDLKSSKKKSLKPTETERMIIQDVEDEIEQKLEEKAAKTNLNAINVKNLIKHVVMNEHVLALVRKAEDPSGCIDEPDLIYEPKLTRAKAKQLSTEPPVPWVDPKDVPKVQVLLKKKMKQELIEQKTVQSEGENDDAPAASASPVPNLSQPAPTTTAVGVQTCWSEDGLFKIPAAKSKTDIEEDKSRNNRSKPSSYNNSPHKEHNESVCSDIDTDIEEAPPDQEIDPDETPPSSALSTSTMEVDDTRLDPEADMEYDDDWLDFLKQITMPLDEIKMTEDEEQDPEYNILADEEVDKVDKEELRMDKAVKISKKELNALISELLDCANMHQKNATQCSSENAICINPNGDCPYHSQNCSSQMEPEPKQQISEAIYVTENQILIMEQQMRQHVQLLTQNFLLTYQHPEFHICSAQFKEYLWNLNMLCERKERSAFCAANLPNAIKLVKSWEARLERNDDDIKAMRSHFEKTAEEAWQHKQRGAFYIPTFPTPILETLAYNDVFLYTSLLPKIPYKSPKLYSKNVVSFTDSEDSLIALGLEQFSPLVMQAKKGINRNGDPQLKLLCSYIQTYMLQYKDVVKIYNHIKQSKANKCGENPIKYYYRYKKAPNVVHFVMPLEQLQLVPPCRRPPNELPYQLKQFIHPNVNLCATIPILTTTVLPNIVLPVTVTPTVCLQNSPSGNLVSVVAHQRQILPKPKSSSKSSRKRKRRAGYERPPSCKENSHVPKPAHKNLDPITKFIEILCRPSDIKKLISLYCGDSSPEKSDCELKSVRMPLFNLNENTLLSNLPDDTQLQDKDTSQRPLPSMPQLSTPMKNTSMEDSGRSSTPIPNMKVPPLDFSSISSLHQENGISEVEFCESTRVATQVVSTTQVKEEMVSSSSDRDDVFIEKEVTEDQSHLAPQPTVKHPIRKDLSYGEKKRMRLQREFRANLSICAPEDPEVDKRKCTTFALKYYDKMRETMVMEDYHKVVQILNDYEEGSAVDLYRKIDPLLRPKYQSLADEFLLFLREKEAVELNQLIPWIRMNNRWKFLGKLETFFKDQPGQVKKVLKGMTELSQMMDLSMEKIKATIVPMFKGNAVLEDLFLQDYMYEKPPPSLLDGPYETIDIAKEIPHDEESFEMIAIPDVEDQYGGQTCICTCHEIEDPEYKSRLRHCIRCGIKFVNGKAFIQSKKGLRPATYSFLTNPEVDHSIRLTGKSCLTNQKRRCDTSPFKHSSSSPSKENCDEESDYDGDSKKKSKKRPPRKYKKKSVKVPEKDSGQSNLKRSPQSSDSPSRKDSNKPIKKRKYTMKKSNEKKSEDKSEEVEEKMDYKPGNSEGQQKRFAEESDFEDNNHMGEIMSDVKVSSPGHNTAESESEFCEESSQDNCESDSNCSIASDNTQSHSDCNSEEGGLWKREEDKIILEAFQKENDKKDAFDSIARQLGNRTTSQIKKRFDTLIKLLMETIGKRSI